jgi:hypothetical protein
LQSSNASTNSKTTTISVADNGRGGGLQNYGTVQLTNFAFINCTAVQGGAIYQGDGSLQIAQGKLSNNRAWDTGGALYVFEGSADVAGATFLSNMDVEGAPNVYVHQGATLKGCDVFGLEVEYPTLSGCQYDAISHANPRFVGVTKSWSRMMTSFLLAGGGTLILMTMTF